MKTSGLLPDAGPDAEEIYLEFSGCQGTSLAAS
jgi:hypothetical protein